MGKPSVLPALTDGQSVLFLALGVVGQEHPWHFCQPGVWAIPPLTGVVGAGCRERAGSCIEERHHLPLALALPVFPPQSRVDPLGIACSTHPAETGISASHQSLKLARMLDEPTASFPEVLTRKHIGAHPVGISGRLDLHLAREKDGGPRGISEGYSQALFVRSAQELQEAYAAS